MEKIKIKAHAALFSSGLLFGANYWIAKGLMPDTMQPMQIIFVRGFAAMLLFWLLSFSL
jgi:drug/metabolite transporter (DMT)-like permease